MKKFLSEIEGKKNLIEDQKKLPEIKIRRLLPEIITFLICLAVFMVVFAIPLAISDGGLMYKFMESHNMYYIREPSETYSQIAIYLRSGKLFDLRWLGGLYAFLTTTAIVLMVHLGKKGNRTDYLLAVLAPLIFTDFAYTVFFSTLLPHAIFLIIFLILSATCLWATKQSNKMCWLLPPVVLCLFLPFCTAENFEIMNKLVTWSGEYPSLMFVTRPHYISNFTTTTLADTLFAAPGWSIYSSIKTNYMPHNMFALIIAFIAYTWCAIKAKVSRVYLALPLLALVLLITKTLPTLFFNLVFDMFILTAVIGACRILRQRNLDAREKFGVTQ